jgi:hypothetical protein
MSPNPYLRPKLRRPRPTDQPTLDQRCLPCRAGACKACVVKTCPCAETGHGHQPSEETT